VIIDHGRLVADGTPGELRSLTTADEFRFAAPTGLDLASLSERLRARVTEEAPGEFVVSAAPEPATVAALTAWLAEREVALGDLRATRQSLEDVFLRLTRDPETA
jgi:ABC-2 type transport system ATP-binding protein